ncbi:MAG: YihY/virulence factor BrkB family protein [Phycisphaerales bacterium]
MPENAPNPATPAPATPATAVAAPAASTSAPIPAQVALTEATRPRTRDLAIAMRFAFAQVQQSQAPAMAANLAFRTLFGLLPVLVVTTIVTRALLGDGFIELVHRAIELLGLHEVRIEPSGAGASGGGDGAAAGVPLGAWIEGLAREAANIDLSAIGFIGALAVVFSAVWTMVAIEASFNTVYRAPQGRALVRRVLIYWFVITAGPVLFAAVPFAFSALTDLVGADSTPAQLAARVFSAIGAFVSLWLLLGAAYATVPNTKVDVRAAILGAFVAAALVELGKRFLGASLAGSFAASRLYGSLGLVPLFMLWVYLMWLAVLFGLQTAAILQGLSRGGRSLAASVTAPDLFEPSQSIGCYRAICARFGTGRGASVDTLVRNCGVAPAIARELLLLFERHGLAHRIEGSGSRYAPSRPPATVTQAEVLRVGFALSDGGTEAGVRDEIAELRDAQLARLGNAHF